MVCVDIQDKTTLLLAFIPQPWIGNMTAYWKTLSYLKKYNCSEHVFDTVIPSLGTYFNDDKEWKEYYRGSKDEIMPNIPKARGP